MKNDYIKFNDKTIARGWGAHLIIWSVLLSVFLLGMIAERGMH